MIMALWSPWKTHSENETVSERLAILLMGTGLRFKLRWERLALTAVLHKKGGPYLSLLCVLLQMFNEDYL